jgi:hypothetical protein
MSAPIFSQLVADSSVTNPSAFTTLLTNTLVVTGTGSKILAIFSASGEANATKQTFFRILYDGVVIEPEGAAGSQIPSSPGRWSAGATSFWEATPGSHTIELQWYCSAGTTSNINPTTSPDSEHAALYTEEVPGGGDGILLATQRVPVEADLAVDKTANNDGTTFSTLVSGSLTTVDAASQILITMIFSGLKITNIGAIYVRIKVDGTVVIGGSMSLDIGYSGTIPIVVCPSVTVGAHTILVEFVSSIAGANCLVVTNPTFSCCHLVMQEKAL